MRKLALCLLGVLLCANAAAKPLKPLSPGTVAPNDLGATLSGQQVTAASLRGKVVVISFWATWCKYCLEEMPILGGMQAIATQRHLPLQVVEINFEQPRMTFVRAAHLLMPKLPGLLMTWDRTGALAKSFGVGDALPAMIILHRDGTVAKIDVGYDKSELDPLAVEITRLVNEPAPPTTIAAPPSPTVSARPH